MTRAGFSVTPRFYPASSWLRRIVPVLALAALRDHPSGLTEDQVQAGVTAVFTANATVSALVQHATEVFLGRRFQVGGFSLTGRSQITKRISLGLNFRIGQSIRYSADPFQGYGKRASVTAIYQPSENLNFSLAWTYSDLFRTSPGKKSTTTASPGAG